MNKRQFLGILGGGTIVAATGAGVWSATREPTKALAPWTEAGSAYDEPRRRALSYAILAPNPHNRQPWLVDLGEPDRVTLYVDTNRLLPHTDPYNRQITIGLGCFIELLTLAAAEDGFRAEIDLFPSGSHPQRLTSAPVATVRFIRDAEVRRDPLFAHAIRRRSNKDPFDVSRPVPQAGLDALVEAGLHNTGVGTTRDSQRVAQLRALTEQALVVEIDTPHTYRESVDLFRIGKAEVEADPDGIDFSGPLFETLSLLGQFDRAVLLDRESGGFSAGLNAVLANAGTAMAYVWIVTNGNSRADQIAAGRDWLRINLAATRDGLAFHPLSQALQEYPEMATLYRRVHAEIAPGGGTVQMLSRLGYGKAVPPSPRWALEKKIIGS